MFLFFKKNQIVTHVSTSIFQGLPKNVVFRSVALVTKKLWGILDFFSHRSDFLPSCLYPTLCIKKNLQKILLTSFH